MPENNLALLLQYVNIFDKYGKCTVLLIMVKCIRRSEGDVNFHGGGGGMFFWNCLMLFGMRESARPKNLQDLKISKNQ